MADIMMSGARFALIFLHTNHAINRRATHFLFSILQRFLSGEIIDNERYIIRTGVL
jgi:hypothetical protein